MAPRGGGGSSASSGGGRASGGTSSSGTRGGTSSSFSGSKGKKSPGSKGSKRSKGPKSPRFKGGSSSSSGSYSDPGYHNSGGRSHGSSGAYVSAAVPSRKNPLSFLNLGSGRKPLMKRNTETDTSGDQLVDETQHLRVYQYNVGSNHDIPIAITLENCQTNRTLSSSFECAGNDTYVSGYVVIGLVVLMIWIFSFFGEYVSAKIYRGLPASAENGDTANMNTANGNLIPDVGSGKFDYQEAMGDDKSFLVEKQSFEVINCKSEIKETTTYKPNSRKGWLILNCFFLGIQTILMIMTLLYARQITAILFG